MCVCTDIIIKSGKSNAKRLIKEPNQDKVVTFTSDVFSVYPHKLVSLVYKRQFSLSDSIITGLVEASQNK